MQEFGRKMDGMRRMSSLDLPRSINVTKFAECRGPELEALHAIVSSRTEGNFCVHRNKRRRTTSHENQSSRNRNKRKRKQNNKKGERESGVTVVADLPRKIRRRMEFKKNLDCGFIVSGDGTKRLRTHLWYAKRFMMTKLWGFYLPLGLHGKGRGSRAILKRLVHGVLIRDTSYHSAIQLEGAEDSLISVLNTVMIPSHANLSEDLSSSILSGAIYTTAMLHHVQDPSSSAIAPVSYMWRPCDKMIEERESYIESMNSEERSTSSRRNIWVWLHAAAFDEGFTSLTSACQKYGVGCVSLEGKLGRLELVGENTAQMIQKVIPSRSEMNASWGIRRCSLKENNGSISSFIVKDPRKLQEAEDFVSNENTLWECSNVEPPIEEHSLCMEKHKLRMKSLFLVDSKENSTQKSDEMQGSRFCPVLVLNNSSRAHSFSRCTLLLPINWVKVFWNFFILNGAHAIGLREIRWIASEMNLPSYPYDFPDCRSWSAFKKTADIELDVEVVKRPPNVRPFRVPMLSPWNAVYDSLPISQCANPNITRTDSFPGYVARSSTVLSHYLGELDVNASGADSCRESIPVDHKLCFVRVAIRAFKKGSFEEGALVCAPKPDDMELWAATCDSSSEGLQIPESIVRSSFTQDMYGLWKFHAAEDPELARFRRSPVGFVTTGFVRGSKKPVAVAVCDAFLLARVRLGQGDVVQPELKPGEIFVLVRNLRSTAYRLGVATILINQYDHDTDFM